MEGGRAVIPPDGCLEGGKMKKATTIFLFLILAIGCVNFQPKFCPDHVISKIRAHTVSIATYYIMDEETISRFAKETHLNWYPIDTTGPQKAAAVIGSGTIIKDNHVITVRHMFDDHYGIPPSQIWVFIAGWDHAVRADMVAKSWESRYLRNAKADIILNDDGTAEIESREFWDDYAVIKLREDVGLPGLPIGKEQPKPGEKIINSGSTGGFAWFTRYSRVAELQFYFRRASDATLHLTPWENFPYMVIYPGGPGDLGGSICNTKGELVGIMYCGLTNYSEEYVFANPTYMLHEFLEKNGLSHLK